MLVDLYQPSSFRPLDGATIVEAAEDSRRAGLAFVNAVCEGADRWDLARWLAGPYRRATRHAEWRAPEVSALLDRTMHHFDDDLATARARVLALLERMGKRDVRIKFVECAQAQGLVVPCVGDEERGWVPAESVAGGLAALVGALFVADYLVRPGDYRDLMLICPACQAVLFDPGAKLRGDCGLHDEAVDSGVRVVVGASSSGVEILGPTRPHAIG
jgi:hypothetical protein